MELQPTFWRTCRALANMPRLEILRLLAIEGEMHVLEVASLCKISNGTASAYLRTLNARGLIQAQRNGRFVYYHVEPNKNIPFTDQLLNAMHEELICKHFNPHNIFMSSTAFANPRRICLIKMMNNEPLPRRELTRKWNYSPSSLSTHIWKLESRGFVKFKNNTCSLIRPTDTLRATMLNIALSSTT